MIPGVLVLFSEITAAAAKDLPADGMTMRNIQVAVDGSRNIVIKWP